MPVNPEVLRDFIRRFGAAAVKAAKEKVMVPNMTGTATAASTSLGSIPKVESTVGKEAAVAAMSAMAPVAGPVISSGIASGAQAIAPTVADLAAFEATDRLPQVLYGGDRLTEQGAKVLENAYRAIVPDGEFEEKSAPYVHGAGTALAAFPTGVASSVLKQAGVPIVHGAVSEARDHIIPSVKDYYRDYVPNRRFMDWYTDRIDERQYLRRLGNNRRMNVDLNTGEKLQNDILSPGALPDLLERYYPEAVDESIRRATARMNNRMMDVTYFYVPQSEEILSKLRSGEMFIKDGAVQRSRFGHIATKRPDISPDDFRIVKNDLLSFRQEPFIHATVDKIPISTDLSHLVKSMRGAQRARDFVYDTMKAARDNGTARTIPMVDDALAGKRPMFPGADKFPKKPSIEFSSNPLSSSLRRTSPGTAERDLFIGIGDALGSTNSVDYPEGMLNLFEVVGHETAHANPVYNTRLITSHPAFQLLGTPTIIKPADSPYYWNDYSWIPKMEKGRLVPKATKFLNDHDFEVAENYSDLFGVKAAMNHYGVNDGRQLYTEQNVEDLTRMLGPLRYVRYHGPQTMLEKETAPYKNVAQDLNIIHKDGGSIHIAPSKRGTFTAAATKHGKSVQAFASQVLAHPENYSSAMVKKANFARNAAKWHEDGGFLRNYFDDGGSQTMLAVPGTYLWGDAISNAVGNVVNTIKGEKAYSDVVPQMLPGTAKSADAEALQGILKNSGYDIGTAGPDGYFGKKSTMALQSMLVDAGYDIGATGPDKNGIDGIIGNKTTAAYNDWVANGARIKKAKRPVGLLKEDAMPVSHTDTASVYTPVRSTVETKPYEGIYNYGQYYDKRFGNYVTDTGLDLSNISTEGVGENKHVDTFSPFVFDNLSQCKKESARNTLECASHITYLNLDDKRGFNIDRNGLRGSAWTMGDNMVKAGGARLFDIFADAGAPSGKWDDSYKQRTIDFVRSKAKGEEYENYLMENLQPGDVVELLYPNSRKFKTAYDESKGKHQNTHIGYVVSVGGELYIRDNVGNHTTGAQTVHTRKLSSVVSGKEHDGVLITGAVRAKDALEKNGGYEIAGRQGRDLSSIGISPTSSDDASQSRLSNDAAYRAMSAVYNNKNKLLNDNSLSVDEFNRIAGLTQAIMLKESASGELFNNQKWISKSATLPSVVNDANRKDLNLGRFLGYGIFNPIAYDVSDLTGGALSSINAHAEPSSGLGSVKYQGPESLLTDRQRKQLGDSSMIKDALRSAQPETSGVTTFYALCTAVNNIKKILNKYAPRDIAENPDIIDQLAALSYNQGLDKITETLQNAKADGDWDGHIKGLLEATYGKNAMILRGYNNTNMFSDEESKKIEEERKNKMNDLRNRLQKAGIKADAIANMIAQRESTMTNTPIASSGKLR